MAELCTMFLVILVPISIGLFQVNKKYTKKLKNIYNTCKQIEEMQSQEILIKGMGLENINKLLFKTITSIKNEANIESE